MGFFKTGDEKPVTYFDNDGKELSEEDLKKISSEKKEEESEEENTNSEEG